MNFNNLFRDTRQLTRLIWIVAAGVILVAVGFGLYYYWDRYVYLDDVSPYEQEIEHLEQLIREDPQDVDARLALAVYHFENGSYDIAIDQSQQILEIYPDNDGAMLVLGLSYAYTDETHKAIEYLEQFATIRRESPMAHTDTVLETAFYHLGQSYMKTGQYEEAVGVFEEALVILPTDADVMYSLGQSYAQVTRHEDALAQYHNAIRFDPMFTDAYQGMVDSYTALGMSDHAAYARGMIAFTQGDYETARSELESMIDNQSDFAPAHLGLGLTYEQLGDLLAAKASFERVLELTPDDFMASHALNRVELTLSEGQ